MPTRPTKCYRDLKQPYTRREYIGSYPDIPQGLNKLVYGNTKKLDFQCKISLVALKSGQISARALDSIRATIHRELRVLGEDKYRFQIKAYPHHCVRMHGLVGVVKAERLAKGMKQSFGKPIYRMAQIKSGEEILEIRTNDNPIAYGVCKKALSLALKKLPLKFRIAEEGFSKEVKSSNVPLPKRTKGKAGGEAEIKREV